MEYTTSQKRTLEQDTIKAAQEEIRKGMKAGKEKKQHNKELRGK